MRVLLSPKALSLDAVFAEVRSPEHGGVVIFLGTVRGVEDGRPIESIEYEAYASMAEKEMRKLAERVAAKHDARVCLHHRTGRVPVAEAAVIVAASAAHRPAAFSAGRELIDELKHIVPIWKIDFAAVEA